VQIQDVSHPGTRPFNHEELDLVSRFDVCLACHQDMAYLDIWKEISGAFGSATTNKDHEHIINNILRNSVKQKPNP
jgi:hypothetical protein